MASIASSPYFIESVDLTHHPLCNTTIRTKAKYYYTLSYLVNQTISEFIIRTISEAAKDNLKQHKTYIDRRLRQYKKVFLVNEGNYSFMKIKNENGLGSAIKRLIHYQTFLVCDLALILYDIPLLQWAVNLITNYLSNEQSKQIQDIILAVTQPNIDLSKYPEIAGLASQFRANRAFSALPTQRIIVTANMSAGKSTLINALIGLPLARTSQEVCTGNIGYFLNKPYDDGRIHLCRAEVKLNASEDDLQSSQWDKPTHIAAYFTEAVPRKSPVCIIDTPGVDAALHQEHSQITYNALQNENYSKVVYIVEPTNLGTDAEIKHLKWVAEHLKRKKILFVLNKMDGFQKDSDNMQESIEKLQEDLNKLGWEHPVICPISAYFGLLLKLKYTGQPLTEDEEDEFEFYRRKFSRDYYDLSRFYYDAQVNPRDTEYIKLYKKSGLYGLEQRLYGGSL